MSETNNGANAPDGTMVFRIKRFDPDKDTEPYFQDIDVPLIEGGTILDYLLHIKWFIDGTLTLRYSCQSAICGSCAMRVNGHAKLACKSQAHTLARVESTPDGDKQVVILEALGNQKIEKDLVVDIEPFFAKYEAVKPTLQPKEAPPADGTEYRVRPADFEVQRLVAVCIQCGACYSDCNTLAVAPEYLGPAALAKAFRFVTDPRDGATEDRLLSLVGDGGIWDCTRCCECTQVCPKEVGPMERIVELRTLALRQADVASAARGRRHGPPARRHPRSPAREQLRGLDRSFGGPRRDPPARRGDGRRPRHHVGGLLQPAVGRGLHEHGQGHDASTHRPQDAVQGQGSECPTSCTTPSSGWMRCTSSTRASPS